MKRALRGLAVLLVLTQLLFLVPCAAAGTTVADSFQNAAGKDGILKVLSIGNSYSQDALNYLPQIFKYSKVKVAFLHKGSCTLEMHADYAQSGEGAYTYYKYDSQVGWKTKDKATLLDSMTEESWDVITLQTTSTKSGQPDTFCADPFYQRAQEKSGC